MSEKKRTGESPSASMKLLPCPFCGSKARITTKKPILPNGQRDTLYVVSCELRECMVKTRAWYPLSAAVATWNRRAKQEPACVWSRADEDTDTWETSCGSAFMLNDGTPKENLMKYCPYCGKRLKVASKG